MSREIEFRGLKTNGEFVYGYYVEGMFDGTSSIVDFGIAKKGCYPVEVKPETVGQFTGLLDCNGVRIFEGDIINHLYPLDYKPNFVEFKDGAFRVSIGRWVMILDNLYIKSNELVVIGNIHQNSELLK